MRTTTMTATTARAKKISEKVFSILQASYSNCGGFVVKTVEDLIAKPETFWKVTFSKTGEILVVIVYERHKYGHKAIMVGSAESAFAKKVLLAKMKHEISSDYPKIFRYCEVSGAMSKVLLKEGIKPIHAAIADFLLEDKTIIIESDNLHYTRMISGKMTTKLMFGNNN